MALKKNGISYKEIKKCKKLDEYLEDRERKGKVRPVSEV